MDVDIKNILANRLDGKARGKTNEQVSYILTHLKNTIDNNIDGDIVELGCYVGHTSLYIQKTLCTYDTSKQFHVYDSWKGLPSKHEKDNSGKSNMFKRGYLTVNKKAFIDLFNNNEIKLPHIHSGWFGKIPDSEYPNNISFAFFDGDFYTSIMESFNKVYHKMSKGGIIVIDDCGNPNLPGCKIASMEFLIDKPEDLDIMAYGINGGGGMIIKK